MRVSTRSRVAHSADRINIAEHELAPRTSATIEREDGQAGGLERAAGLDERCIQIQMRGSQRQRDLVDGGDRRDLCGRIFDMKLPSH